MNRSCLPLVVALSLGTSGCWLGKQTKVKVPPAPSTAPAAPALSLPPPTEGATATSAPVIPPPEPASEVGQVPQPPQASEITPAPAPKPAPPGRRRVVRATPPAPPLAQPPVVIPPPATGPLPQLAEILTSDQRRQYQTEYAQDVTRANGALKQAGRHNLNATQKVTVDRIRTFLSQAAASRDNDIATALQLSRRADLLGQELLKDLR